MADEDLFGREPPTERKWFHVNRKLLPVKGFYFFCFAAVGCLLPFIPIYMHQLGFTPSQVGFVYGLMPFISFFVRPLFGLIADKLHSHKLILVILVIAWGILYDLLLIVPPKDTVRTTNIQTNIHCDSESYIRDCMIIGGLPDSKFKCPIGMTEFNNLTSLINNTQGIQISCSAECIFALPGSYSTQVCFSDGTEARAKRKCVNIMVSLEADQTLRFSVVNIGNLMALEIQREATYWKDITCRDYDLENLTFQGESFRHLICDEEKVLNCKLSCDLPTHDRCSEKPESYGRTFWMFFIIFLFANIAFAPIISLNDAIAYDLLGTKRNQWGKQRLFGTIGFALFAITSTFIMDSLKKTQEGIDYSVSFYVFGGLCFLCALVCWPLEVSKDLKCSQFLKNVQRLLTNLEILAFLFTVMCMGIMTGAIETFLYWFLQDLGSSQLIIGLCIVMTCVAEIPLLMISGKIIKKIGQLSCLYIACLAYAVRFFGYSLLTNPWYVLPIETLHGITFGLMWAAATSYVSIIAPKGMSATAQGLLCGLHFGFGKGLGSIISGLLFDVLGERWTFRTFSIFSLVLFCLYTSMNFLFFKNSRRPPVFTDVTYEDADANAETSAGESLLSQSPDHKSSSLSSPEHNDKEPNLQPSANGTLIEKLEDDAETSDIVESHAV